MNRILSIILHIFWLSVLVVQPIYASEEVDGGLCVADSLSDTRDKSYLDSLRSIFHKPVREVNYDLSTIPETQTAVTLSAITLGGNDYVPTSATIDISKEVGEIPITSGTSHTGSKTYDVAIDIPDGMNGFRPRLSIAYDSHMSNSVLGKGWGVSGVSAISRTGKNIYHDNAVRGILLTNEDNFQLDGVRLVPIQNGVNYIVYETEHGNVKVKSYKNADVIQYFEVFYPDGNKGVFGFSDSKDHRLSYPITSLTDLHGNTIKYEYTFSNNIYHISKISYNGASVEFTYTSRKDQVLAYCGGLEIIEDRLLQTITCKSGNTILKTYNFRYGYQTDKDGSYVNALLTGIDCMSSGKSLNPLQFYYGTGASTDNYNISETLITSGYESEDPLGVKYVKGRFDYKSSSDGLIILPNYNPYYKYYKVDGKFKVTNNRFDNLYEGTENIFIYTGLDKEIAMPMPTIKTGHGFIDIICADIKGQQEEYIVKVNNYVENKRDILVYTVYSSTFLNGLVKVYSRSFDMGEAFKDADGKWSIYPKFHYAGDFNGDGKMEILCISADQPFGSSSRHSECNVFDIENGSRSYSGELLQYYACFIGNETIDPVYSVNYSDKLLVIDYDGDGKTDVCHINNAGLAIYSFDSSGNTMTPRQIATDLNVDMAFLKDKELLCGEFNGDGFADLLISPSNKTEGADWLLLFSKGNGEFAKGEFHGVSRKVSERDSFIIQDIDGDGRTDLVRCDSVSFASFLTRQNLPATEVFNTFAENTVIVPTNINSHNRFDQLIGVKGGKVSRYAFQKNYNQESLLTGMINSYGVIERNDYVLLNDKNVESEIYIKGYDAVFPYVNIVEALPVLAAYETFAGGTSIDRWTYRYTNAVLHRQGKGFCGFAKIESIGTFGRIQTKEYDPCLYGALKSEKTPEQEISYEYNDLTGADKIAKVNLISKVVKDILKGFTATTSYKSYDSYGYPQLEETVYSDGSIVSNKYAYASSAEVKDGYNLGFLRERITTSTVGGKSYVERLNIPASNKRLPLVKVLYKDGNQVDQITTLYDAHGNPTSASVKQYSSTNQQKTLYTYDSNGRVTKSTYPTGLSETYSYDNYGRLKSVKSILGETTTFGYDAFGRQTSISYPDSTIRTVEYKWASVAGSLYALTYRQTGRPDSTIYYDALNREVRCMEKRFDGALKSIDRQYDTRGNLWKVSQSFKTVEPYAWNEFEYDNHGRLTKSKAATGKTTIYTYSGNSETENDGQSSQTRKYDVFGNIISLTDPSGTTTYEYAADGQLSKITAPGGIVTTIGYDKYRRQISMTDPSLGEVTYTYDNSGNLASQTDADDRTVSNEYDAYNRLIKKISEELTSVYTYDTYGQLKSVIADNGTAITYSYDSHGRIIELREDGLDNVWLKRNYVYSEGNLAATVFTSGKGKLATETYTYANGHLKEVILNNQTVLYRLYDENSYGQQVLIETGPVTRRYVHTGFALPHSRTAYTSTDTLQNQGYLFDPKTGNMLSRTDNIRNIKESFSYDSQNRLTKYGSVSVSYDVKGNILSKGDAGTFSYAISNKPYAVSGLTSIGDATVVGTQDISYTSFSRPAAISEEGTTAEFDYNSDGDRVRMCISKDGKNLLTRHYLGPRYECEVSGIHMSERLYLAGDVYSAPALIERTSLVLEADTVGIGPIGPVRPADADVNSTSSTLPEISAKPGVAVYYILRDCVGSVTHILSSQGKLVQEYSYDAWGRLRDPGTQVVYSDKTSPRFSRGYTGHEHLPQFGVINMNARLYDPLLGRFLSPDPNVQAPFWSQNFNRYTYAMNNPLCYIDEDGEFFWFFVGAAALIGGISNVAVHWKEITSARGWNAFWKGAAYFGIGAAAGGIGAAAGLGVSAWIGSVMGVAATASSGATLGIIPGALVGATNGFTEGFLLHTSNSLMQGENIGNSLRNGLVGGAMDAALGSVAGGVAGGINAHKQGVDVLKGSSNKEKTFTGYFGFDESGNVKYVGSTGRDSKIRFAEHHNSNSPRAKLIFQDQKYFTTRLEARIWEQKMILKYVMIKNGGVLYNKINAIAPKYWKKYGIKP